MYPPFDHNMWIMGLWGILTLIQGVMMLTMTQADFERKYVLSSSTFPLF